MGTPTTGNNPVTIPMLIAIYTKKLNETPKQSNLPKVDLESLDITSILYINNKNNN